MMKEKQRSMRADNLLLLLGFLGGLILMGILCEASGEEESKAQALRRALGSRSVSAMFVLGDSSVDCGDNTLFYSQLHRNLSLLPCNASHRTLLPYLLAEKMGLPYAVPFYTQNGSIGDLTQGLNFGSAQATIMNPGSQGYQSLNQQLRQVTETVQLLNLQLDPKSLLHFVRSAVFYLSFGKDDFVNLLNPKNTSINGRQDEFARILASEMERTVRSLHDLKIRRIVCVGILPLGCAPQIMASELVDPLTEGGICSEKVNEMVLEFNVLMEEMILGLNGEFPDARVVFLDVYQGMKKIIAEPLQYGIEDAKSACCGVGSYGAEVGCLSAEMACANSESHVWWDQYNPTRAVNALLASSAWFGQPFSGLARPITVQELVSSSPPHIGTL